MKNGKVKIVNMSVDGLLENVADYNPRSISIKNSTGLGVCIEKFGYLQMIIFNERTETIVGGHKRLIELKKQGFENVDVTLIDISLEDEKALNVLLNSPTITGDFTAGINNILDEICELSPDVFDLASMSDLYVSLLPDDEKKTEVNESKDIVEGMPLLPYEHYDCILVVFDRRDDFMFLSSKLKLDRKIVISSPSVENKKLGVTRAVRGTDLIKAFEEGEKHVGIEI